MSEVLITLGIIGIVAALTIPSLLSKYHQIQWRTSYKKVYSSINQALKYMSQDDGIDLSIYTTIVENTDTGESYKQRDIGRIFKYLSKYYNATTTCFDGKDNSKCWECNGEAGYLHGEESNGWNGCTKENSYAFVDTQGVAYYLYSNYEFPIVIDVNGKRNPNQLGRDRFVMYFGNSLDPDNLYPSEVDAVLLWGDKIKKERWCPQGECYYKSWIRGQR